MIKITQEMVEAFGRGWARENDIDDWHRVPGDRTRAGLEEAMPLIENAIHNND